MQPVGGDVRIAPPDWFGMLPWFSGVTSKPNPRAGRHGGLPLQGHGTTGVA